MSTFPSPVSVAELQIYLRDATTETAMLDFYQALLDTATEKIYTYLDRDYSPEAVKTDVFFGNGLHVHRMSNFCGTLIQFQSYDIHDNLVTLDLAELVLMANGHIVVNAANRFLRSLEYRIKYAQPDDLVCPESVKQVITEVAAIIFEESKQGGARLGIAIESDRNDASGIRVRFLDLTPRQIEMLAPYKRAAV
jgi:hypothetical protein